MQAHEAVVPWKAASATIGEVALRRMRNVNSMDITRPQYNLRIAPPLKHYRKELGKAAAVARFRSLDDFDRPGGALASRAVAACATDTALNPRPNFASPAASDAAAAAQARRRVRRSANLSGDYFSGTAQYLDNRKKSFRENQFQYFRAGNATDLPGAPQTRNNVYAAQGSNDAYAKFQVPVGPSIEFTYSYMGATYAVSLASGAAYDVEDLNAALQAAMLRNGSLKVDAALGTRYIPLQFVYDNLGGRVALRAFPYAYGGGAAAATTSFTAAGGVQEYYPYVNVSAGAFQHLVGFAPGSYPSSATGRNAAPLPAATTTPLVFESTTAFQIGTVNFRPVFYKPSNYQFATQGGVSAGDRLLRLKYNTVTRNGALFRSALGSQVAAAMAYSTGLSDRDDVSSLKARIGFPLTASPRIDPLTGAMCARPSRALW